MADITTQLRGAEACRGALEWIEAEGYDELRDVWDNCERGDWLLWFVYILGVNPRLVVNTAIECARVVADTPRGQLRKDLIAEVELAESWAQVDASHVKRALRMIEIAVHRGALSAPDKGVLRAMVEIVRQRIAWGAVASEIAIADGKIVRVVA